MVFLTEEIPRSGDSLRLGHEHIPTGKHGLTPLLLPPNLKAMEIHLNPDVQARLTRIAAERGSDAELLAREAIEHFVDYDDWFLREVEKGVAQIVHGEWLTHQEVGTRIERLLEEKQSRS